MNNKTAESTTTNMNGFSNFNLHGRVKMSVYRDAPTVKLLEDIFHPFIVENGIEEPNLVISGELEEFQNGTFGEVHGETDMHYNSDGVFLDAYDVQVFREGDRFRLNGKIELLVMTLPLIDALMQIKGASMIHALTVAYNGKGLCMPAWGGAGKTTTMAKLMKKDGFSFMGDDWAFLTEDGQLLGYTKPMFLKPYHKNLYPHLFKSKPKPLVPVRLSKSLHSLTTRVHPLVTRYPRLAAFVRRWSPEHMMVTPQMAFPEGKFTNAAPLTGALFVERFESDSSEPVFEEKDHVWMTDRLVGNFHSEMPRQSRVVLTSMSASGHIPMAKFFSEKARIIESCLEGKPSYLLQVPKHLSPDQASDIIVEHIEKVLSYGN